MQTIAKLATRLDMSAEEAAETLRKLHIDVEGVEAEINDDQCDMLIDIDEDPSAFDAFLQNVKKKEEEQRKRTERLQKAARAAAKKKAAAKEKAEAKKKAEEEKAAAAAEKKAKATAEATAAKAAETDAVEVEVEAPVEPEAPAAEPPVEPAAEETPAPEQPKAVAEILPALPEEPEQPEVVQAEPPGTLAASAAAGEHGTPPETVRAEGAQSPAESVDQPEQAGTAHAQEKSEGALAAAQRRELEDKRQNVKFVRPLPTPDPEVVAEVIRKAHERSQKKTAKTAARPAPAPGAPPRPEQEGGGNRRWKPAATTGKTARKKKKRAERQRDMSETLRREAAAAVRGVQAGAMPGALKKRRKKREREDGEPMEETSSGVIEVDERLTVEALAEAMGVGVSDLILDLMDDNIMATKNQVLELELVRRIADLHGFEVQVTIPEEEEALAEEPDLPEDLVLRAPVVTVMGHVDHGKTSFLDYLRRANVVAKEAGGITQHIAAYDVEMGSGRVVFLDTPGHEAFTQMRARGARATDVVVLVVAADDGVKPQTIEAIDHARAAEVPIVVAINKCDKPDAQPDRVRQELTRFDLVDEAWGGKTVIKNISAQTGDGITELMEHLALEAEMLELKANPNKRARGVVIESEMSTGYGPVAWVLVQQGTLRVGDVFLSGATFGRVRSMINSRNENVREAGPATPILVTGFNGTADAGDAFTVLAEERVARGIAEKRQDLNRKKRGPAARHMTLEDFHERMAGVEKKQLNILIKADTQGSVDVLRSSFLTLGNEEVSVNVVHSGVGGVNESDALLASASDAVIIGFQVTANSKVQKMAEDEGVEIRHYNVIYEALGEVRKALEGLLTPEANEVIMGHAEVRELFRSSAFGTIAGCQQLDGVSERGALARLVRDGAVVYTGRIGSLRRNKDDVKSVATGFECGIKLERFDDLQQGDIIETYRVEKVARTLG